MSASRAVVHHEIGSPSHGLPRTGCVSAASVCRSAMRPIEKKVGADLMMSAPHWKGAFVYILGGKTDGPFGTATSVSVCCSSAICRKLFGTQMVDGVVAFMPSVCV